MKVLGPAVCYFAIVLLENREREMRYLFPEQLHSPPRQRGNVVLLYSGVRDKYRLFSAQSKGLCFSQMQEEKIAMKIFVSITQLKSFIALKITML